MTPLAKTALTIALSYGAGLLTTMTLDEPQPAAEQNESLLAQEALLDAPLPETLEELAEQNKLLKTELQVTAKKLELIQEEKEELEVAQEQFEQLEPEQDNAMANRGREAREKRLSERLEQQSEQARDFLAERLDLTDGQAEILGSLMQKKIDMFQEARAQMKQLRAEGLSREELKEKMAEYRERAEAFQQDFEQELENTLTTDQMDQYVAYEQERASYAYERQVLNQKAKINLGIPNLTESQKSQVNQALSTLQPDLSQVKVGSYGTPGAGGSTPRLRNSEVIELVSDVLTEEQIKSYKSYSKQQKGGQRGR